ncbi:MAG: hypothetical protein MZU97_19500 [Bacillus subtilis]|nr:hypothetical protein [Bacillus subtilis]
MLALLPLLKKMGVDTVYMLPISRFSLKDKKGELGSPYGVASFFDLDPNLKDDLVGPKIDRRRRIQSIRRGVPSPWHARRHRHHSAHERRRERFDPSTIPIGSIGSRPAQFQELQGTLRRRPRKHVVARSEIHAPSLRFQATSCGTSRCSNSTRKRKIQRSGMP